MSSTNKRVNPDYNNLEVSEPYLGPWWAFLMLVVYFTEKMFPTTPYTFWWYLFIYVICLLFVVTAFTVYKRLKFNRWQKAQNTEQKS